ncbi:MAG: gliding motility-associated C-terminal domain-containing protein [Ferruginibacter sp.]
MSFSILSDSVCTGDSYLGRSKTGIYKDTLTAASGCDSIRILNLFVRPLSFSVLNDSICTGDSYLGYSETGIYKDTLTATNGCDSFRTLNLVVKPQLFLTITDSICDGQSYLGHTDTGIYVDTFTAANGCDSIRTLQLVKVFPPNPNLGIDTEICRGNPLVLSPGLFDTYLWQDGSTQQSFAVKNSGVYSVTVTNLCGLAKDEITVSEINCDVYFPSAFVPDGNNKDDAVFKILNPHNLTNYLLAIYNRWGEKIFETTDYTKGWDGTFKGQPQNIGGYVWYCEFIQLPDTHKSLLKGSVVLIR